MKKYKSLAILALILILSACSVVTADGEGIEIRHSSENNLLVQHQADEHCAGFGKKALKVQETPASHAYLVGTVVTTFKCVN
ncbi:MAG: hypothetical protein NWR87_01555 [Rhodospirillales bacterium]|nr:hypothetical protein [Rhodospirillales bacterium]